MRSFVVSLATILITAIPQTGSACCLWPFFPTYAAGYGGYGYPAYGYAPAYYGGYAPAGYGNCGSCGSCGYAAPTYTSGYAGYGISCGSGCCESSSCGSIIAAPVSSGKPVPDPISDRDRDNRTYEPPRDDREPLDGFDRSDSLDRDRDRLNSNGDWDRSRDRDRGFELDRDLDTNMPDFDRNRSDLNNLNDTAPFRGSNRPEIDSDIEPPTIDRSSNKPPMNTPVEEDTPVPPASESNGSQPEEPANNATEGASGDGGEETAPEDLLPPEQGATSASANRMQLTERELRSSHYDVRNIRRLAWTSRTRPAKVTQISSSQNKQHPLQWISVPLPEGRNRL